MGYNVIDIIDKLISIEEKACGIYRGIVSVSNNPALKLVAQVFVKEEERHVQFYNSLKSKLLQENIHDLDFSVYDKVSFLLDSFKSRMDIPKTASTKELVCFILDFEKQNMALLIDIQGRLVRNEKDAETLTYKALNEIIEQEKTHIKDLEKFCRD